MNRKKSGLLVAGIILIWVIGGCIGQEEEGPETITQTLVTTEEGKEVTKTVITTEEPEARERVLRVRLGSRTSGFEPGWVPAARSAIVMMQVYSSPMARTVPGSEELVEMDLCESIDISADGLEYTFNMREGVQWHKGYGEATADDLEYTIWRVWAGPKSATARSNGYYTEVIEKLEVVSKYSLKVTLKRPSAEFLTHFGSLGQDGWLASKAAEEEFGEEYGYTAESVVGTGPFFMTEFIPGERIVLEKFPDYYGHEPWLDKIIYTPMVDETTAMAALLRDEIDFMDVFDKEVWRILGGAPGITRKNEIGLGWRHLNFNVQAEPFTDVRVRKALAYAINQTEMIEAIIAPTGWMPTSSMPPGYIGHLPDPFYTYDPDLAKSMLKDVFGDRRVDLTEEFGVTLTAYNLPPTPAVAEAIQLYWSEVGVDVDLNIMEVSMWVNSVSEGGLKLSIFGMSGRWADPISYFPVLYTSTYWPPGTNMMYYDGVDDLVAQAEATPLLEDRIPIYEDIQRKLKEDMPQIPIFWFGANVAFNGELINADTVHPDPYLSYGDWFEYIEFNDGWEMLGAPKIKNVNSSSMVAILASVVGLDTRKF